MSWWEAGVIIELSFVPLRFVPSGVGPKVMEYDPYFGVLRPETQGLQAFRIQTQSPPGENIDFGAQRGIGLGFGV